MGYGIGNYELRNTKEILESSPQGEEEIGGITDVPRPRDPHLFHFRKLVMTAYLWQLLWGFQTARHHNRNAQNFSRFIEVCINPHTTSTVSQKSASSGSPGVIIQEN